MISTFRWSPVISLLAIAAVVGCSDNATAPEASQIAKVSSTSKIGGLGQIGNFVWNDLNANGIQDSGEPGIPGVVLNLTGSEVLTTTTSATGGYAFTGLTGGTYQVTIVPPAGMVASPTLVGADRGKDSNVSGANVTTTAAGSTATDITIDFGFYTPTGRIGDFVWSDLNGNGIQDSGEPGIAGVIVTLNGPGGTKTAVTGASGAYQFTGLVAGCYTVAATNPIGYASTQVNVGSPATDSNSNPTSVCLATPFSVDLTADFGYIADAPQIRLIKMTNNTDNNFAPGVMIAVGTPVIWTYNVTNTGNVLLTNVVVTDDIVGAVCTIPVLAPAASLTCSSAGTATAGQYTNIGTAIGTPPVGPPVSSNDPDNYFGAAPSIALIKRTNGTDNNSAPGPTLIVGSPVTWTYEAKNTGNVLLLNVIITDDKIGSVCTIPSLAPGATDTCMKTGTAIEGQYTNMGTVTGSPPVGHDASALDPDNYFGILANTGTIGDFVWSDLNGNGVQDGGEPGISGVLVSLTGPLGPMSTTTDANGAYAFSSLTAGCYTVTVASPASTFASPSGVGGDPTKDSNGSPANVCLAANNSSDLTIDFGFVPFAPSISLTKTTNGTDNNSAPGPTLIVGTPVTWTYTVKNTGNVSLTGVAVTDDKVGAICVIASLAPGASSTCASNGTVTEGQYTNIGSASGTAPDGAVVNAQDPDNYLGYIPNIGTIGDFVWKDLNANGVQDSGEPGIAGVVVSLNGPGGPQTATTNGSGGYVFSLLTAGCYTVSVATPTGYAPTVTGAGTASTDSNVNGGSACLPANNSSNLTVDFGFIPDAPSITVLKKTNGTNNNTAPGPSIIVGAPVTWTYEVKNTGNVTLTNVTVTDNKIAGTICTVTSLAPGATATCSSTGVATVGQYTNMGTATGTPPSGPNVTSTDPDNYFGFVPATGKIGDYVWSDENGDGIQGGDEAGIGGLTVTLTGPVNATTVTDDDGLYLFSNLPAGTYTVTVATPGGYTQSPSLQGGNTSLDSNGTPATVVLPTNSTVNLTIDFGFMPISAMGRMTGGGQQIETGGLKISRGFTLHCDIVLSNNLEINWAGGGTENNFHIIRPLQSAVCINDPKYKQPPPAAPFNTFIGVARGKLNGVDGAMAYFTFIDDGEPGKNDLTKIVVYAPNGTKVLDVNGKLDHGNIQMHYDQPHGSKAPR